MMASRPLIGSEGPLRYSASSLNKRDRAVASLYQPSLGEGRDEVPYDCLGAGGLAHHSRLPRLSLGCSVGETNRVLNVFAVDIGRSDLVPASQRYGAELPLDADHVSTLRKAVERTHTG